MSMTESKIRALFFAAGATAVWVLLAYLVAFGEAGIEAIATLVVIALFLTVMSMGQGS
jgi:low affinity Fe/Cu permease